jgi:hypothetical protein
LCSDLDLADISQPDKQPMRVFAGVRQPRNSGGRACIQLGE